MFSEIKNIKTKNNLMIQLFQIVADMFRQSSLVFLSLFLVMGLPAILKFLSFAFLLAVNIVLNWAL